MNWFYQLKIAQKLIVAIAARGGRPVCVAGVA